MLVASVMSHGKNALRSIKQTARLCPQCMKITSKSLIL